MTFDKNPRNKGYESHTICVVNLTLDFNKNRGQVSLAFGLPQATRADCAPALDPNQSNLQEDGSSLAGKREQDQMTDLVVLFQLGVIRMVADSGKAVAVISLPDTKTSYVAVVNVT